VRYTIGYDFIKATPENAMLAQVGKGHENSYNAFAQLKHSWKSLILNAGLRYDHKVRFDNSRVNELSPRLALIYLRPKWNVKLSYSKSFVDAPYFYQKINQFMPLLQDNTAYDGEFSPLHPETLHSYQLTFAGSQWMKGLDFELNFFHNTASELIFTNILGYDNSGKNKTIGAEIMAGYKRGRLTANFNATWIHTLKSSIYFLKILPYNIDHNNSTPAIMANLTTGWQTTKNLRLYAKASFQGKQTTYNMSYAAYSQIYGIIELYEETDDEEYKQELALLMIDILQNRLVSSQDLSSRIIFDLGGEYRIGKVSLGLDLHNLFNIKYNQSGMNTGLVPQRGRWFMASLGYQF
jgi:iron complex outermembrane receptor protein